MFAYPQLAISPGEQFGEQSCAVGKWRAAQNKRIEIQQIKYVMKSGGPLAPARRPPRPKRGRAGNSSFM
jgi:hypothetical protein